jgi:hypothetical protein
MKNILSRALAFAGALFVLVSNVHALNFTDNFSVNPLANGWNIFGDTNLFQWNATNHNIAVKWDSSQPNSYFYHPLGITLTTNSSFSVSFDLNLNDAAIYGGTFQLATGLLNFDNATNANFLRGTGDNATNVVEFDYFMDPQYGNSVAATELDTNGLIADVYDNVGFDTNTTYHISITYFAGDALISSQVTVSNQLYSSMPGSYIEPGFGNFNVDTLAIMSYNDAGSYDDNGNVGDVSILAHGTVANFSFTTSPNPVGNLTGQFSGQIWQAQFQSFPSWNYALERSTNLQTWISVVPSTTGTGGIMILQDTNAPTARAFYRIHAQR